MDARTGRPRLEALTGVRYFLALCVFATHMALNLPAGTFKKYALAVGWVAMPVWFALSGFLMSYNYTSGFRTAYGATLRTYIVHRIAKIYPIYLVSLLLWLALVGNVFRDMRDHPADAAVSLGMTATMTQNWAHVPLYTDTSEPRTASHAHMWIAWSVSVEVFFYLMFPLVIVPVARFINSERRAWIGCGVVYLAFGAINFVLVRTVSVTDPHYWVWIFAQNPYICFGAFLMGVLAGQAILRSVERPLSAHGWWLGVALLAASVVILFCANHWIQTDANKSAGLRVAASNVLYAPLAVAIIYTLARIPCRVQRFLGTPTMVLLGEASYCMYLIHPLVQHFFVTRIKAEDMQDTSILIFHHVMLLACLHFLCFGMYRYGEVPARTLVRWIFGRRNRRPSVVAKEELVAVRAAA